MSRAKKELITPAEKELITPPEELNVANSGLVSVTLLKSIQVEPGAEPLKPGVQMVSESLAEELKNSGLISAKELS
jgi:hypothetical protein